MVKVSTISTLNEEEVRNFTDRLKEPDEKDYDFLNIKPKEIESSLRTSYTLEVSERKSTKNVSSVNYVTEQAN